VRLFCENIRFAMEFISLIEAKHFDVQPLRIIFDLAKKHVLQYETEIDQSTILVMVDGYILSHAMEHATSETLKEEVYNVFHQPISSEEFLMDTLVSFIKRQEMKKALLESVHILEQDGDYERVLKLVDSAVAIGSGRNKGMNFEDMYNLPEAYRQVYSRDSLISTGIPGYDSFLSGGMAPGELHVIQGPPGQGKSTIACCIGAFNAYIGKAVFHVTLEISEIDVLSKYFCRLTGMTYQELLELKEEDWRPRIEKFRQFRPRLHVKHWPEETVNALQIQGWVSGIRASLGISPDILVIDYDDCLLPVGGKTKDSMYLDSANIYKDLINLGNYFGCPVLTLAQPKREAWDLAAEGHTIMPHHVAHSSKKVHKAWSVSSLNFKPGENDGYLYGGKVRRGKTARTVPLTRNLEKSYIGERTGSVDVASREERKE